MDTSDRNTEHTKRMLEQKRIEQRHRIEAHRAADNRRSGEQKVTAAEHGQESKKYTERGTEKKSLSDRLNANDVANVRKREQSEGKHDSKRLEKLAREKISNLSESQRQELQRDLESAMDRTDPHWRKEDDRIIQEAESKFKRDSKARRDFCPVAGTEEHKRWEEELSWAEQRAGHVQGKDYDTEAVVRHPDGKPVRLDHVDYRKDIITDLKPIARGETEEELKMKYEKQRERHIEAYEHSKGRKVLYYRYSLYPSPKDI